MDSNNTTNTRQWTVLNWNIRGINIDDKCNAVRNKIEESACPIFCILETKRQQFDMAYFKKIAPKRFGKFAFSSSVGASGGILVGWNNSIFTGTVTQIHKFALIINFTSIHNGDNRTLAAIYGPCAGPDKQEFVDWLNNLNILDDENWLLIGDFNLYRSIEDRNRDGANMNDIMLFNEIISEQRLQEIPLKGRNFTWSNMHEVPLLQQIDWCFTSTNWILDYPNTLLLPLSRPKSDHIPCMAQIGTCIPKAQIFRFENYWIEQPGFMDLVQGVWNSEVRSTTSTTRISAKFKLLRRVLKCWGKNLSKIKNTIQECNNVLLTLQPQEANFRRILKKHILKLLQCQKEYRRKRYTIRWTKFGDEGTSFFHAAATVRYRINTITSIDTNTGPTVTSHQGKATLLWEEYKDRIGQAKNPSMIFNVQELLQRHNLSHLSQPFTKEDIDEVIKHMPPD